MIEQVKTPRSLLRGVHALANGFPEDGLTDAEREIVLVVNPDIDLTRPLGWVESLDILRGISKSSSLEL